MTNLPILQIAVPTPLRRYFDYLPLTAEDAARLQPGMRVRVPFRRRELVGIFIQTVPESTYPREKLKTIVEIIDTEPVVPADILQLSQWAMDYYHYPLGEILSTALPVPLRQGKPAVLKRAKPLTVTSSPNAPLSLNSAQQAAVTAIQAATHFQVFLVDGITGSGKTEVYLHVIAHCLQAGKQILILVPEIGLTPQTIRRFQERFAVPIVALHSGMTEKQRLDAWLYAKTDVAKIIIGTRSAVFTPFANLGLIVIDEEHDLSFKQQEGFRYHARDVAIMRAHQLQIPIILGTATPSLETLHNAQQQRYQALCLPERAGSAQLPEFQLIDIRQLVLEQGLSTPLLQAMHEHLANGEQVMLFLNRRGFAPVLMCPGCGWMAMCQRCDTRMTYHYQSARLHCHHCDTQKKLFTQCENCGVTDLHAIGQGTERLEAVLQEHFSQYSIARIDRDSTRLKGSLETTLAQIHKGEHHILLGTQMLAKGHHFPNVTLVGIVDADGGFFSADFRALERMGQLILQVAGRAGRAEKPGKVMIQTYYPDHPLLTHLLYQNYRTFSQALLQERQQTDLPPYAFFALFRAEAHQISSPTYFLQQVKQLIGKNKQVHVLGPLTAPMPRRAGRHRVQLLLQAAHRKDLQRVLKKLLPEIEAIQSKSKVRWSLDVDPLEMF